jgi:hypothetical protein
MDLHCVAIELHAYSQHCPGAKWLYRPWKTVNSEGGYSVTGIVGHPLDSIRTRQIYTTASRNHAR